MPELNGVSLRNVLVVEDEPGILSAMKLLLELEGYRVLCASNGEEALAVLTIETCDLIVTDYMMPRMTGGQLIKKLRSDPEQRNIPIILVSAVPPPADIDNLIDAFLRKPFEIPQLLAVMELHLLNSR